MKVNDKYWDGFVSPIKSQVPVFFIADQSKTGYAYIVADLSGNILSYKELSGAGEETETFCTEFPKYFTQLLSEVEVETAYYEQMVAKDGMKFYHSSEVLHDVRVATKNLFKKLIGSYPEEINNMSWKGAVLPDGYRGHKEKGSKRYLTELNPSFFGGLSDNMTDVYCMYLYVLRIRAKKQNIFCYQSEELLNPVSVEILPESIVHKTDGYNIFDYNPKFSLDENINYFANRSACPGLCALDITYLSVKNIYDYAKRFTQYTENPWLVIRRSLRC